MVFFAEESMAKLHLKNQPCTLCIYKQCFDITTLCRRWNKSLLENNKLDYLFSLIAAAAAAAADCMEVLWLCNQSHGLLGPCAQSIK